MCLAAKAKLTPARNSAAKRRSNIDVVISAKRFKSILGRAHNQAALDVQEIVEEEERYKKYLEEGNAELVRLFENKVAKTQKDRKAQLKAKNDEEERRAKESNVENREYYENKRKETVERAYQLLELLKPGPSALNHALIESDMYHERKYYDDLNAEFAEAQQRQQDLDRLLCPEAENLTLHNQSDQDKNDQLRKEKLQAYKTGLQQQIAQRQAHHEREVEDMVIEGIKDRETARCLLEKAERRERDRKLKMQAEFKRDNRNLIKQKHYNEKCESVHDAMDNRRGCVFNTAVNMLNRCTKHYLNRKNEIKQDKMEKRAMLVYQQQQQSANKCQQQLDADCEQYEREIEIDQARRLCKIQLMGMDRKKDCIEDMKGVAKKIENVNEIKRYEKGLRFRNEEAKRISDAAEARQLQIEKREMTDSRKQQREDFHERRIQKLYDFGKCPEDRYMEDDKFFFNYAAKSMITSKNMGRPLYPLERAVESYKRENHIERELQPQKPLKKRNDKLDHALPGYVERTKLKWAEYERKAQCRTAKNDDLKDILDNCLLIRKMATNDRQETKCEENVPIKCQQPKIRTKTFQNPKIYLDTFDENHELKSRGSWHPPRKPSDADF